MYFIILDSEWSNECIYYLILILQCYFFIYCFLFLTTRLGTVKILLVINLI